MSYLSEDPTYLAGALLLLAGALLIALNVTKQGKYLVSAGIAFGLALAVVLIEWMWVTDIERIEMVVYDVRRAVLSSDAEAVIAHLAPSATYLQWETALSPDETQRLIRNNVSNIHLEFARITELQTSVGQQSRRGKAEFRVFTRGGPKSSSNAIDGINTVTSWSLGFQETEPGVWKITRISPLSIPNGILALPGSLVPSDESQIGLNDTIGIHKRDSHSYSRSKHGGPSPRRDSISPANSTQNN
jgi:hypothetical protein